MFHLTLIYEDQTTWFAGGFKTMDDAKAWADEEKTRSYWKSSTKIQIIDYEKKPPVTIYY